MNMKTPDYNPKYDFIVPCNNTRSYMERKYKRSFLYLMKSLLIPLQHQLSQCHFAFCVLMKLKDAVVMDCHLLPKVMELQRFRTYASIMRWLLLY